MPSFRSLLFHLIVFTCICAPLTKSFFVSACAFGLSSSEEIQRRIAELQRQLDEVRQLEEAQRQREESNCIPWWVPQRTFSPKRNNDSRSNSSVPNSNGEIGKIYMLTVWTGTSRDATSGESYSVNHDYIFKRTVEASRKYFESNLSEIGLDPMVEDRDIFGAYVILSGADTNPQKIVDTITELAARAGEDDALFVYVLSHGWALDPMQNFGEEFSSASEATAAREHLITPLIDRAKVDFTKDGIWRSNLLHYMRSRKHRLDVLITDSPSSFAPVFDLSRTANAKPLRAPTLGAVADNAERYNSANKAFRYLLTHAFGAYSWNSTNPCSFWSFDATKEGVMIPPLMKDLNDLGEKHDMSATAREASWGNTNNGTVFNMAFMQTASRMIEKPENGYTFNDFFQDLGADYDKLYQDFWKLMYNRVHMDRNAAFVLSQGKTTLAAFNVEDDHISDPTRSMEIMLKTNNRVKEAFVHRDYNEGSGKTGVPTVLSRIDVD